MHSAAEAARWSNLTGQILHGEGHALGSGQLGVGVIHRRLAEHGADALVEQCFIDAFHIVAVQQAQTGQVLDAQQADEFVFQTVGLDIKAGLFFHINTIDHWVGSPFVFYRMDFCVGFIIRQSTPPVAFGDSPL